MQTLRRLAVRAARWPVVGALTRAPYWLAARSVTAMCRRYPQVACLHATGSYARNDWTPGLSDIDCSALLRNGASLEAEFAFLEMFWAEYRKRVRWFPMLGELEIMALDHAATFSRNGYTGYAMRDWRLLTGEPLPFVPEAWGAEPLRAESLRHALRFYRHHFPQQSRGGSAETRLRLYRKVHKALGTPDAELADGTSRVDFMAETLALMDRYGSAMPVPTAGEPVPVEQSDRDQVDQRPLPEALAEVAGDLAGIVGANWDEGSPYVVLRDGLDGDRTRAAMAAAAAAFAVPVVMTQGTFQAFLDLVDPFLYYVYVRSRIVWGEADPLLLLRAPGKAVVDRAIQRAASDIYIFPFMESLEPLSEVDFRNLYLGWILRMQRYLEDGVIDLDFDTLEAYFARTGRPVPELPASGAGRFALCRQAGIAIERMVAGAQSM